MRNKFPGNCYRCGKFCEKGAGYFEINRGQHGHDASIKWLLHCEECVRKRENEMMKKRQAGKK